MVTIPLGTRECAVAEQIAVELADLTGDEHEIVPHIRYW